MTIVAQVCTLFQMRLVRNTDRHNNIIYVNLKYNEIELTTHVRAGESTLKELGRLLKFVSGTPGIPSGDVKWSASWPT
jgi:hypothetical protein